MIDRGLEIFNPRSPLSFPAPAEGAVGLDDGAEAIAAGVGEVELGGEEAAFGVEHFEITRRAALEAVERDGGNAFLGGD